jgi:translation initiation factor IF-1
VSHSRPLPPLSFEGHGSSKVSGTAVAGTVRQVLPSALFRVTLDDGKDVTVGIATGARRILVKVVPGDRVEVTLSPFDPTRGKIVSRL